MTSTPSQANKQKSASKTQSHSHPQLLPTPLYSLTDKIPTPILQHFSKQQLEDFQKQQSQLFSDQSSFASKEQICAICHQPISIQTPSFQCKLICHKYFHIKCLSQWFRNQRKNQLLNDRFLDQQDELTTDRNLIKVSCPLCRQYFPTKIDQILKRSEYLWREYFQNHFIRCNLEEGGCGEWIYLKRFKCLLCKGVNLCQKCYISWKHSKHDRFLMKDNGMRGRWEVAWMITKGTGDETMVIGGRGGVGVKGKLDCSINYIKEKQKKMPTTAQMKTSNKKPQQISFRKNKQHEEYEQKSKTVSQNQTKSFLLKEEQKQQKQKKIFDKNYDKYMSQQIQKQKPSLLQYIKDSLIDIEKQIYKTYKKVDYDQQAIKCIVCGSKKIIGMKRMINDANFQGKICKHFIDEKCLMFLLKNGFYQCPIDKRYFLNGLEEDANENENKNQNGTEDNLSVKRNREENRGQDLLSKFDISGKNDVIQDGQTSKRLKKTKKKNLQQ